MPDGMNAFMATMVAQTRPVPLERAVQLVRQCYGLVAGATPLTGERDENFRITTGDDREYVLKIANPAEDAAVTDLTTAVLLHLEIVDPPLPCPRVVREVGGGTHVRFVDEGGTRRTARLLTYLRGTLLGKSARSPQQRAACGRMGARLSRDLREFEHPAAHRTVIWDVKHTGYLQRLLAELPDFPYRTAALDLLARLVPAIESRLPQLRHQVVHNDLNPLNLLVDPADEARVTGVIDFGDLTHTALIGDVAVAAAELIPADCPDAAGARTSVRDVATAYHESLALQQQELAMLGTLVAARLLMNLVVHEWHVHHNPANRHYAALDRGFMCMRLEIADRLACEEIRL